MYSSEISILISSCFVSFMNLIGRELLGGWGLWTFDRLLFLPKVLVAGEDPMAVELKNTDMWVQIFDLPIGLQSDRVLRDVGNFM